MHPTCGNLQRPAMRRAILPLLILASVVLAAALAWLTLTRAGSSSTTEITTKAQPLPPFSRVAISGAVDVNLIQGDREDVAIEAPSRSLVAHIEVEGRTLT